MAARRAVCFIAFALTACDDERAEPSRRGPPMPPAVASHIDCVAASRGGIADFGGGAIWPKREEEIRAKRAAIVLRLCEEDDWPLEAATCYANADGLREIGRCWMPPPLSTHLTDELQALMRHELHLPR